MTTIALIAFRKGNSPQTSARKLLFAWGVPNDPVAGYSAKFQNTRPLISISLNNKSAYCGHKSNIQLNEFATNLSQSWNVLLDGKWIHNDPATTKDDRQPLALHIQNTGFNRLCFYWCTVHVIPNAYNVPNAHYARFSAPEFYCCIIL